MGHNRAAHEIAVRRTDTRISTEDMRVTVVRYASCFDELLEGAADDNREAR
ncbi:hypothetical protein [Nocardia sp. NPDC052112]|uniref:hypothetical protein n=1 Tax=Nocardia sp. NPDC052112 TaxID=3155646 RepID=UPI00341454CC